MIHMMLLPLKRLNAFFMSVTPVRIVSLDDLPALLPAQQEQRDKKIYRPQNHIGSRRARALRRFLAGSHGR